MFNAKNERLHIKWYSDQQLKTNKQFIQVWLTLHNKTKLSKKIDTKNDQEWRYVTGKAVEKILNIQIQLSQCELGCKISVCQKLGRNRII